MLEKGKLKRIGSSAGMIRGDSEMLSVPVSDILQPAQAMANILLTGRIVPIGVVIIGECDVKDAKEALSC